MFLVSSCNCRCEIYWNQVLSRKWICSWSNAHRPETNLTYCQRDPLWLNINEIKIESLSFKKKHLKMSSENDHHSMWWLFIISALWCRHEMETFFTLLAYLWAEPPSPATGGFHSQRPVTQSFDIFFDQRLNKRLSKQSVFRWFEMALRSLWRHCNVVSQQRHWTASSLM